MAGMPLTLENSINTVEKTVYPFECNIKENMLLSTLHMFENYEGSVVLTTTHEEARLIGNTDFIMAKESLSILNITSIDDFLSKSQQYVALDMLRTGEVEMIVMPYDVMMSILKAKKQLVVNHVIALDLPSDIEEYSVFVPANGLKRRGSMCVIVTKEGQKERAKIKHLVNFLRMNGGRVPNDLLKTASESF